MSSLVERLRVRSERRPIYNLDESDDDADFVHGKAKKPQEKIERFVRDDAKEDSCQACGESENLLHCETCTYAYHPKCLLPPLKAPFPSNWRCPECVSPLNDIDKLLDSEMRPTVADDSDATKLGSKQIFVKQYLVKWKGLSYLHCSWVLEKEFLKAFKSNPRLKTKVNNFNRQMASNNNSEDDFVAIRPEWTTVDRILACRGVEDEKEYLVKYKELPYDECYWEFESDVSAFQPEIERFNRIQSRSHKSSKQKSSLQDVIDSKKKSKEFQQCEHSPEFLSGGSLHPYQLEGLNFLRFSWSKQTHVILADEMGLGKTIQSIAFLASLFEESISPHLVVAPLSTLRNWEREFATWAPQMNVVMHVGSAQARAVIREYEFYYPKKHKKIKKKKSGQVVTERKQDRIKFDVLLTSYEMINLDTTSLKPIKWECMIVDEGHRLKNKDSKLFISMKQYYSNHRVLLTGTPLQNNLDELFMLMHFLDAGKFASLEEFQEEFKDINQEEQISRLHKMLAPHLLRRVKKDVMKELPPKKELILRVELSSKQKEYYKAILTRNYQILTRHGGAQISLINVVMELRKLCCHPYMLGVEPDIEDTNESFKQLVETSGKLQLLDKMMVRLKEHGHRVLIYSQFQHMLDLLEDYCTHKKWTYERIDGKVAGAERQVRIDRFNAKNSSRFCFLLSTRAGGLGINLATADTVIIYDSDWNPHADLQAMARAHRLGQTNKVMIYRLITRGTIEERMMQMTKKKMVLEHLVVGRLKAQNINQEELDDIIRYGSKDLFADENDEAGKSRQIHYDDAAIHQLLDREQIGDEETSLDDEEEDGFLKAFKVANFEYIDKAEAAAEKEAQKAVMETKSTVSNSERTNYWEELLKDTYEVQKIDESNALGKGKRSRKQMVSVEEDDLAGLEDVSSDVEDDNYEAELTDGETTLSGIQTGKRPYKKKGRVDNTEPIPLMEGEGRSFRVLGFNQNQRAAFVQILMRFGAGDYDWKEFAPRLKQKTYDEVENYGRLFLAHIAEDLSDSPNFSDGVPKEGLRIQDVLIRITVLLLIRDKARFASENPGSPLYTDDIMLRYPGLKSGKFWKQEHDSLLLHAVLKHGYGRWQAIVDDKDLRVQEIICKELNLPFIRLPVLGQAASQAQNGSASNMDSTQAQANGTGNDVAAGVAQGTTDVANQAPLYQDSSILFHFRDMQRRQVEFIKKRVLLLERGLYAEYQKEYFGGDIKASEVTSEEADCETMAADRSSLGSIEINAQLIDQLPQMESIASEEISAAACDDNPDRLALPQLYNKMCMVVEQNVHESVQISLTDRPASLKLRQDDVALQVSKSEMLSVEAGSEVDGASHIRHLNLISRGEVESIFPTIDARKLRTFFSTVDVFNRPRKFKSLRTLKLQELGITELPDSICKLIHLRYLYVSNIRALPESITNLYHLETLILKNCAQLPTLGCFPRLKILKMIEMDIVQCIGNEFYSRSGKAGALFPALKELTLFRMHGLEEWMVAGGEGDRVFPCLEKLSIQECGELKSILICGLSSLVEFEIDGCGELRYLSGEFDGFTSLQLLRIQGCGKLTSIPSVQHCTSLVELNIWWCSELITIPGDFQELKYSLKKLIIASCKLGALPSGLQCCASLEELEICYCQELIHINDLQDLSALQRLCIYRCHKLISIDWHGLRQLRSLVQLTIYKCGSLSDFPEEDCIGSLTQLKELKIGCFSGELEAFPAGLLKSINLSGSLWIIGWDKLKSVPHQLQHLTALKTLSIYKFKGDEFEEALPEWLANLSSLQHLRILDCKNLKYLPSSTAIQRLSKLEQLIINGCPLLEENCREDNGCEWPKISHIPKITTLLTYKFGRNLED